jgi:hypothetical protein
MFSSFPRRLVGNASRPSYYEERRGPTQYRFSFAIHHPLWHCSISQVKLNTALAGRLDASGLLRRVIRICPARIKQRIWGMNRVQAAVMRFKRQFVSSFYSMSYFVEPRKCPTVRVGHHLLSSAVSVTPFPLTAAAKYDTMETGARGPASTRGARRFPETTVHCRT